MCKYCERRTDVKLGWDQPELPWHDNYDITSNISGNEIPNILRLLFKG